VRDAAWEYMKFMGSRQASKIRTDVMVAGGLGRFVNPEYLHEFGYDDIIRLTPKGWLETFKITLEHGEPEPYGKNCQFVYQYMTQPLNDAEALMLQNKIPEDKKK
jgi:multiple sugar transport system permease protein